MAYFFSGQSHTFNEYLLVPGYSSSECIPDNVSLRTPLTRFRAGEEPALSLNVPMVSAVMQSVSGEKLAAALARDYDRLDIWGRRQVRSAADIALDRLHEKFPTKAIEVQALIDGKTEDWVSAASALTRDLAGPASLTSRVDGPLHMTLVSRRPVPAGMQMISHPVYISIDKDVLSRRYAVTNWDQGDMSLAVMEQVLADVIEAHEVIGVDICGDLPGTLVLPDYQHADRINAASDRALYCFFKRLLCAMM